MAGDRLNATASHGRLHRRGHSTSSLPNPTVYTPSLKAIIGEKEPTTPASVTKSSSQKIKPYLRKLSTKEKDGLDLSRTASENQRRLAGLGITARSEEAWAGPSERMRAATDLPLSSRYHHRHHHQRSASSTSYFSTPSHRSPTPTSTLYTLDSNHPAHRQPGYTHNNTSPHSVSNPPSPPATEPEEDAVMAGDSPRWKTSTFDQGRRSGSPSSAPGVSPALRIQTGSSTRLGSYSQSSLSLTSPVLPSRARGDTLTTSPSSRSSLDKALGKFRGAPEPPMDPLARRELIRAAREKYDQKHEAKARKSREEEEKRNAKEIRKRYQAGKHQRRRSESEARATFQAVNCVEACSGDPDAQMTIQLEEAPANAEPTQLPNVDWEKYEPTPRISKTKAAMNYWQIFLVWFKTRLLRIRSHMHKMH